MMKKEICVINLPAPVAEIIRRLNKAGYSAYAVGGCVRDSVMGLQPHDWDVATQALPEQVMQIFADARVIETGLQHGTVTVRMDNLPVEVTTYRQETGYSDHRRPDAVRFIADIDGDLARRDFTVNAMAYHPDTGLYDPFGGLKDVSARLLRCVGDPRQRFDEDALRIMRALRFSAVLGYAIESNTAAAIRQLAGNLSYISRERLAAELVRLLCGDGQTVKSILLEYRDVLAVFLPGIRPMFDFEQHNPHHVYDVYTHTAHVVAETVPEKAVRLAALYHDAGKPHTFTVDKKGIGHFYGHPKVSVSIAARDLKDLKMDNATIERVKTLIKYHDTPIAPTEGAVKRWLNRLGEEALRQLISLKIADNRSSKNPEHPDVIRQLGEIDDILHWIDAILEQRACFQLKDLAVKGNDLTALGVPEGPHIGQLLQYLLEQVMDGQAANDRQALLALARQKWKELQKQG